MRETFVELVRRYVEGEIPLEEVEDWEAARFQSFAALPVDDPIAELWARFQSCVAEMNRGHRDEAQSRAELRQALSSLVPVRDGPRHVRPA